MPVSLTRGDRSLLVAGGSVFLVLLVIALLLAPTSDSGQPTSYSAGSGGSKAAYLLLKALRYDVDRWERPPAELDAASGTTLIVTEPISATPDERRAILRFVGAGGRVIVTGTTGAALIGSTAGPDAVGALNWAPATAAAPSPVTQAAPAILLAPASSFELARTDVPLYVVGDSIVVAHLRRSKGDIYWWASPTPITNAGIGRVDNLRFVLESLGRPGDGRILFDEYFHGYRPSLMQSVMRTPVKWILAQVSVFLTVVLLTYARRSGPIVPGVTETRLSPLEFVRTLGGLYRRARGGSIAVEVAYGAFRARLNDRFGIPASMGAETAASLIAMRRRVDEAALTDSMRACEAARETVNLRDGDALELVQNLHDRSVELGLWPAFPETP